MRTSILPLLVLGLLGIGCSPKIGDPCTVSTDCSLRGERTCDLSYLVGDRGECIIEGCSRGTCPKEAACVKVYTTAFLSVACNPDREDVATYGDDPDCVDGVCPPLDDCAPEEVCLPEGVCADEVSARTSCRRKCKKDGDCRDGYRCERTGSAGVYFAPTPDDPRSEDTVRICVPDPDAAS
ncbi:MAG: hypothetical protein D6705_16350 [Deltaproteobacteria bacterium]|nr:MAG: hypothetical protein D6705_16350 [Deltaproteobacteria bacterium]